MHFNRFSIISTWCKRPVLMYRELYLSNIRFVVINSSLCTYHTSLIQYIFLSSHFVFLVQTFWQITCVVSHSERLIYFQTVLSAIHKHLFISPNPCSEHIYNISYLILDMICTVFTNSVLNLHCYILLSKYIYSP